MKHLFAAMIAVVLGFAPSAAAQPAVLDAFLEQRVTQELAADGILLARLDTSLDVELVGEKVLVSLVDMRTGKAVASTKIDALPADREAAAALITQVAANLAVQLGIVRAPATGAAPLVEDQRARDVAEQRYRKEALGFDTVQVDGTVVSSPSSRVWQAHLGDLKTPLEPLRFYEVIERPDLAARYRANRRRARVAWVVCGVMTGLTLGGAAAPLVSDAKAEGPAAFALVIGTAGTITAATIAIALTNLQNPIKEAEAKSLAEQHNQKLRHKLGLPTAARARSRVHDVAWTPQLTDAGGGLAVFGRF